MKQNRENIEIKAKQVKSEEQRAKQMQFEFVFATTIFKVKKTSNVCIKIYK